MEVLYGDGDSIQRWRFYMGMKAVYRMAEPLYGNECFIRRWRLCTGMQTLCEDGGESIWDGGPKQGDGSST